MKLNPQAINSVQQQRMLALAIQIAATAHLHQLDQGKKAYILHPLRVMNNLTIQDPELQQIAILHDVMEDCHEWTLQRLRELGFSERVLAALALMTKSQEDFEAGDEGYFNYIRRMFSNLDAMLVKIADLTDNSDLTRMKGLRDKDMLRTMKYMKSFAMLRDEIRKSFPHISF
jgi:(p)ppGpp synthase/HD superfamily hydrolase